MTLLPRRLVIVFLLLVSATTALAADPVDPVALKRRFDDLTRGFLAVLQAEDTPVEDRTLAREILLQARKMQLASRFDRLRAAMTANRTLEATELLTQLEKDMNELAALLAALRTPLDADRALLNQLLRESSSDSTADHTGHSDSASQEEGPTQENSSGPEQQNEVGEPDGSQNDEPPNASGDEKKRSQKEQWQLVLSIQKRVNVRIALYDTMKNSPDADEQAIRRGLAELGTIQNQILSLVRALTEQNSSSPVPASEPAVSPSLPLPSHMEKP